MNSVPRISLWCSFGAPEGLVLLDRMHRIEPWSRVFTLDTGRLPQATYDLIDRVRERYGKRVEVVFPRARDVEEPAPEVSRQSAEMRVHSRDVVRSAG